MSLKDKVDCGFKKYSIGIGDNGEIIVSMNNHPIYSEITLGDTSSDDFQNLGEMFLSAARKCKTAHKK